MVLAFPFFSPSFAFPYCFACLFPSPSHNDIALRYNFPPIRMVLNVKLARSPRPFLFASTPPSSPLLSFLVSHVPATDFPSSKDFSHFGAFCRCTLSVAPPLSFFPFLTTFQFYLPFPELSLYSDFVDLHPPRFGLRGPAHI